MCGGSVAGLVRAGQLGRHALHLGSQEGLAHKAQVRRRTRLRIHRHLQPRILVRLFPIDFIVSDLIFYLLLNLFRSGFFNRSIVYVCMRGLFGLIMQIVTENSRSDCV